MDVVEVSWGERRRRRGDESWMKAGDRLWNRLNKQEEKKLNQEAE